ncbi:lysozyme [Umezawaea sp. Da 62-37]|uniref:lysozyme n=1 Tax=Umezawaea sp. Da 62-37 TaxID=3075927 RepID=UPI0028F714C4|nr:lysozyme [Umezawaea sp. Da 62-37]WNV83937.1 lysozyme [Umezawaea sp. Da 62-37]
MRRVVSIAIIAAFLGSPAIPAGARTPLAEGSADHYAGSQIARHEGPGHPVMSAPAATSTEGSVEGIDVSSHQNQVDWTAHWNEGKRFAYVKASEGTGYLNPAFEQQYNGSYDVGMIRGSYHFALPDRSDGATQANFFVDNGGGWSPDGRTLPGALDVEYNPYGGTCYGLTGVAMVEWIKSFNDTYFARTGRWPVIYTSTQWWNQCTENLGDFDDTSPIWVARYAADIGPLPHPWEFHTIWQYTSTPLDQNTFNGSYDRLVALSTGLPLS